MTDCKCPGGKCQPELNEGSYCWRSGFHIPEGEFSGTAGIAQLVEREASILDVAGSSPVACSVASITETL